MDLKNKILLFFLLLIPLFSFSQINNKRCKWIKYSRSEFALDTVSIFPSSIKVIYPDDRSIYIDYDINKNTAHIVASNPPDSIFVCYTVLPYHLSKPHYQRNAASYDSNAYYRESVGLNRKVPLETREEIFTSPGITKTGNISRGISFGNTQNVFVNSTLNLQMEGSLTPDIRLTAVISDQNIPFQPEGNTQQLQQFDKVYVQLQSKKARLTVGDIVMKNSPSNYLRYSRNVQGAQFEYNTHSKDSTIYSTTSFGIAIAKGKFNTMFFAPGQPDSLIEGVQGPYRLTGPDGETYISVLSNSEKIYLDGRLLKRGFDNDYTIDYNQAEVTFTNNTLITRYSRVRIDFEYTDKIYSRTIVNGSYYEQYKKANFHVAYYQEKDNPNNPLGVTLTDQDKLMLSSIGDSIDKAYTSGIDSTGFNASQLLYRKILNKKKTADSVDSFGYPVVVYSTDSTVAMFQVSFTQVAEGQGNYIINTNSTANGRVYEYAPDTTLSLRIYSPTTLIPTPKALSMTVAGGGVDISKTDNVYVEGALSNNNVNLYSTQGKSSDIGTSLKMGYINKGKKISFSRYKFTSALSYEYNQKDFVAIDRFRDAEFERNWSENVNILADNHIVNGSLGFHKDANNLLDYTYIRRIKGENVNGYQQQLTFNQKIKKLKILTTAFLMKNNQTVDESRWKKFSGSISYPLKIITPGFAYNMDKNVISDSGKIVSSAMYYDEEKFNVKVNDSTKVKFTSDFSIRKDKQPSNGVMVPFTTAHTSTTNLSTKFGKHTTFKSNLTYRYLQYAVQDSLQQNQETILGRTDFNSDFFKKVVRSQLTITTGTGRQAQRQYLFVPVQGGTGNYIWQDKNEDGVQELDEFVPINASYNYANETTYIKEYEPSNTYVKAYYSTFNYRLDLTMPKTWRDKGTLRKFLSKFSNTSSWTMDKKITDPNLWHRFGPSLGNIDSNNVLSLQRSVKSAIFFNRSNPLYGADFNYLDTDQKSFLTQGFQTQLNQEIKINTRLNVKKHYNLKLSGLNGLKTNISNFLSSNNYHVQTWEILPELSFQPNKSLRLAWNVAYTYKENLLKPDTSREKVHSYQAGFEIKYNKVSKHTIDLVLKYTKIKAEQFYTVQNPEATSYSSAIAYEMLQALQNGNNITWSISWLEKLSNGLQLSFSYEGRKTGTAAVVNIGRMQVSALF